jgi:hypothetical protein
VAGIAFYTFVTLNLIGGIRTPSPTQAMRISPNPSCASSTTTVTAS